MGKYLAAIWQCRYFWFSLVRMDLRTRYRRSLLGMGWSLLHPIAMTGIICIVFPRFMKLDDSDFVLRVYLPSVLSGLACWNYILSVSLQGCQCFYQGEMYIRQFPAPIAIFPLRTALGGSIHFLIALALVVCVTGVLQRSVDILAIASLVPAVLLLFVFVWSVAVIAGFANVYFNDTQHLAEIGFQILFYATPIIYLPETFEGSRLGRLIQFNPVYGFLKLIREPIINHHMPTVTTYAVAGGTVLVFVTAAGIILARFQKQLIFKL
jgi:ABC-type polysaccharide/polyol phosphate export permease